VTSSSRLDSSDKESECKLLIHIMDDSESLVSSATADSCTVVDSNILMKRKKRKGFTKRNMWVRFIPATLIWPIWLYTMISGSHFSQVFGQYWPITLAMVFGSFIAG